MPAPGHHFLPKCPIARWRHTALLAAGLNESSDEARGVVIVVAAGIDIA